MFYVRFVPPNIIVRKFPIGVADFFFFMFVLVFINFIRWFRQCIDVRVREGGAHIQCS